MFNGDDWEPTGDSGTGSGTNTKVNGSLVTLPNFNDNYGGEFVVCTDVDTPVLGCLAADDVVIVIPIQDSHTHQWRDISSPDELGIACGDTKDSPHYLLGELQDACVSAGTICPDGWCDVSSTNRAATKQFYFKGITGLTYTAEPDSIAVNPWHWQVHIQDGYSGQARGGHFELDVEDADVTDNWVFRLNTAPSDIDFDYETILHMRHEENVGTLDNFIFLDVTKVGDTPQVFTGLNASHPNIDAAIDIGENQIKTSCADVYNTPSTGGGQQTSCDSGGEACADTYCDIDGSTAWPDAQVFEHTELERVLDGGSVDNADEEHTHTHTAAGGDGTDTTAIHDDTTAEISIVTEKASPVGADVILIEDSEASYAKKRVQITNLPGGADSDAIHDNVASEISAITEKASPVGADMILIEDSADSNNKKRVQITNLPGGADSDAIHDNVSGEISVITEKVTPVAGDFLLIEDSAASNVKKRVQVGNLPGGSEVNDLSDAVTWVDVPATRFGNAAALEASDGSLSDNTVGIDQLDAGADTNPRIVEYAANGDPSYKDSTQVTIGGALEDGNMLVYDTGAPPSFKEVLMNGDAAMDETGAVTLDLLSAEFVARLSDATGNSDYVLQQDGNWVANSGSGASEDSIGTTEFDDGANTPLSGEYIRVDTVDQAGVEYRTDAEVLGDIGAAASTHGHTLEGVDFQNQGTTTTVLHGNAAGNPAFGAVTSSDVDSSICQSDSTGCDTTPDLGTPSAAVLDAATTNLEAADNNTTQLASTSFVQQEINGAGGTDLSCSSGQCNVDSAVARLAGPVFTGDAQAETAAADDDDTSIATTAYVQAEISEFHGVDVTGFQIIIPSPDVAYEYVVLLPPFTGTMTRVDCESFGGTSVTINICDGEDIGDDTCTTSILDSTASTTLECTTSPTADTSLNATGFGARDKVSLVLTAESGTVDQLTVMLTVTVD
jgi:hypothetical protein